MLKIKDRTGETVFVLDDEDSSPQPTEENCECDCDNKCKSCKCKGEKDAVNLGDK